MVLPLLWIPLLPVAPTIEGLVRTWAEPTQLRAGDAELVLHNPHVARSVLKVADVELGLVDPLGEVVVRGVRAGEWTITWTTPSGFERPQTATARPPQESSRSSSR